MYIWSFNCIFLFFLYGVLKTQQKKLKKSWICQCRAVSRLKYKFVDYFSPQKYSDFCISISFAVWPCFDFSSDYIPLKCQEHWNAHDRSKRLFACWYEPEKKYLLSNITMLWRWRHLRFISIVNKNLFLFLLLKNSSIQCIFTSNL